MADYRTDSAECVREDHPSCDSYTNGGEACLCTCHASPLSRDRARELVRELRAAYVASCRAAELRELRGMATVYGMAGGI